MARGGTLTKLRSAIKRWPSFTKLGRTASSIAAADNDYDGADDNNNNDNMSLSSDRLPVYVGKSRRRYLLSPRVVEHPLFRELVGKSSSGDDSDDGDIVVACEVVLFEHMLWMLENGGTTQMDSMDELAEFYTC